MRFAVHSLSLKTNYRDSNSECIFKKKVLSAYEGFITFVFKLDEFTDDRRPFTRVELLKFAVGKLNIGKLEVIAANWNFLFVPDGIRIVSLSYISFRHQFCLPKTNLRWNLQVGC
ncbi:hypothetical protein AGR3A_Lc80010 [Agrobacterium tomkonis CFBP 6623]|uniref:Uncharacterized protein n=1 Tax=Agrobacterium tomkonis CFBP 6623 TaxID=1183432 RepID=A0A1S7S6B3_9HYPH|nr:hypothetical protein AGR3A_Lc80010 [Agrobacterium tomkonis CFBP 6623]